MLRRDVLSTFGVAAGAMTFGRLLMAQAAEPSGANAAPASSIPKPPYLISLTDHLGIVFEADESALKSVLPPRFKPAAGNTVGLNMYRADMLGLVPLSASYLFINIDGFDGEKAPRGDGWCNGGMAPSRFRPYSGANWAFR